jgi:hypothetical protein
MDPKYKHIPDLVCDPEGLSLEVFHTQLGNLARIVHGQYNMIESLTRSFCKQIFDVSMGADAGASADAEDEYVEVVVRL